MNKKPPRPSARNLDKPLVEAGMQCKKRLWIDCHRPVVTELTPSRRAMAEVGSKLRDLARSVFPKGVPVEGKDAATAAKATRQLLDEATPVLFDAVFVADGVVVACDILVRHKDGAVDLYEIKSGTKITQRYLNDLALQVHVLEASGLTLRAIFLLHQNPKYEHTENAEYPPMELLKSAEVTAKVGKQAAYVNSRLLAFRTIIAADKMPEVPMGRHCTIPSACPYIGECGKQAPARPAYRLPELTRRQEMELRSQGILELTDVDPAREGLTFAQRRTIEAARAGKLLVEDFVAEELRQCALPIHFLATATLTEALPRYDHQRPWRQTPYGWAINTLLEDGRVQRAKFAHTERTDPRTAAITGLARQLEAGGTVMCWDCDPVDGFRALLDDLPDAKVAVRTVTSRAYVDLRHLLAAGVFHPDLLDRQDLAATVAILLGDRSGTDLPGRNEDSLRELLDKAFAPRVRVTTRQKIATQIEESLTWECDRLLDLFRTFGGIAATPSAATGKDAAGRAKALPKLQEE